MTVSNKTENKKGQGSIEYILMVVGALIIAVVVLVVVLHTGGSASKGGGVNAQLIEAQAQTTPANSLAFATSLELPAISTSNGVVDINGAVTTGTLSNINTYQVSGGFESEITGLTTMPTTISSISYTDSAGTTVFIFPTSASITVAQGGTFPFAISQVG